MRRQDALSWVLAGVALGFGAALAGTRPRSEGASRRALQGVRRAIQAVLDDSAAGWNAGDLDRFMGAYERSAATTYVSGGTLTRGFDAIREGYQARWRDSGRLGSLSLEILDLRLMGPMHACVVGRYRLRSLGGATNPSGLTSLVFVQGGRGWRIVADQS